jgi:hypothetical protein
MQEKPLSLENKYCALWMFVVSKDMNQTESFSFFLHFFLPFGFIEIEV